MTNKIKFYFIRLLESFASYHALEVKRFYQLASVACEHEKKTYGYACNQLSCKISELKVSVAMEFLKTLGLKIEGQNDKQN